MLIACWSAKGGSGTTVVACSLALLLARTAPTGVVLADLGGDCPTTLGLPEREGPGLADWLRATDPPDDALVRLEVDAAPGVRLLPLGAAGDERVPASRADALVARLADDRRPVVADCGLVRAGATGAGVAAAAGAGLSLLVLRPCYLALRRALGVSFRPSAVVLVQEPGRALGRADVEAVLGVPVRAEVELDAAVARAVDAGLLTGRVPRTLERGLRGAA